jgi:hypothetical protein
MTITFGQIAEWEGSNWAIDVHNQMTRSREPLPGNFPPTIDSARAIAITHCDDSQVEKLAEMILGHARRAWRDVLDYRDREHRF